jgi:hypothetical protein
VQTIALRLCKLRRFLTNVFAMQTESGLRKPALVDLQSAVTQLHADMDYLSCSMTMEIQLHRKLKYMQAQLQLRLLDQAMDTTLETLVDDAFDQLHDMLTCNE